MKRLNQSIGMFAMVLMISCDEKTMEEVEAAISEYRAEALSQGTDIDAGSNDLKSAPPSFSDMEATQISASRYGVHNDIGNAPSAFSNPVVTMGSRIGFEVAADLSDKMTEIETAPQDSNNFISRDDRDPWWEEYNTTNDIFFDTGNVLIGQQDEASSRLQVVGTECSPPTSSDMPVGTLRLESGSDQYMFLDGNEIDVYGKSSPWNGATLHLNYNSKGKITMVRNGGLVGVGTDPVSSMEMTVKGAAMNSGVSQGSLQVTDTSGSKLVMDSNEINGNGGLYLNHRTDKFIMMCGSGCNVGVGAFNADTLQGFTERLVVDGAVRAEEVLVDAVTTGADFVFEDDYDLMNLDEVSSFIEENHHLPGIAPADDMKIEGLAMGEFQIQLLQKVEELTLYAIEQNEQMKSNEKRLNAIDAENKRLREELTNLRQGEEQ
jgi:hypothetical protein